MPDWDQKYGGAPDGLFGNAPNEYVREIVARSDLGQPASALFIADGDGRNSRWLAAQGCKVHAIDLSRTATANATQLDREAGVTVQRETADIDDWNPAPGRTWDAAFIIYLQAPTLTRQRAVTRAWNALHAGGHLIVEAFAKPQTAAPFRSHLGPENPDLLYNLDELTRWTSSNQHVIEALTGKIHLDEGPRHQGEAQVVRYCAKKF